jgi:Outer membrane protein beta-barrel domain
MKKTSLVARFMLPCLFFITFFATANAQKNVKFGAKFGVQSSNISFKSFDPQRSERIGFHVGITSEISFTESLALQPDLIFSSQGFNLKGFGNTDSQPFNYLNFTIPVAYKMNFVDINFGPYFGFLLNKGLVNVEFTDANGKPIDVSPFINKLDVGLALGLTFHIKKFFVGTRYNLGLTNVGNGKDVGGIKLVGNDGKNAVGQLSVGYYF